MDWSGIANLEFYMLGGLLALVVIPSIRRVINNFEKDIRDLYKKIATVTEYMHKIDKTTSNDHTELATKIEVLIEGVDRIGKKVCNGTWNGLRGKK